MSANFIFISNAREILRVNERMHRDVEIGGGEDMWIESCPTSEGFCALHFSSKKRDSFDRVLDIAHSLGLKPFPNYFILGPSTYARNKRPGEHDLWNSFNEIGPPVDFNNDNTPIKIGVIDKSFVYHVNLPGSDQIRGQPMPDSVDPTHGTHVAGIIGATAPSDGSVAMRGLCPPTTAELLLHVLFPSGGPPVPGIQYCFNDLRRVLNNCGEDRVSLVNLSMEWCCRFNIQQLVYLENMLSHFAEIFQLWKYHVVISAGNNARNLDALQLSQNTPIRNHTAEIDVFSSLRRVSKRVTIVGASDMFGQLASFSNYGNMVSLVAPGIQVLSTSASPDKYDVRGGTSQSAPFVTGAMALMKVRFTDLSYFQIVERLQDTVDLHFSLEGKCISGGRLNLGRALGLSGSLTISEEERMRANPLKDQAFVAQYETFMNIVDTMSVSDFFEWYNSDHGRRFESKLSCMLLVQAIDHLRAVDANEFPMLLNVDQRAALMRDLRTPILEPAPAGMSTLQSQKLAQCLDRLASSLALNPPDLLPSDDRMRATRREWETVLRLTQAGEIRTAFLRHQAFKYRSRIEDNDINSLRELYSIFTRALEESNHAVTVLQQHIPEGSSYLALWRNEKKWLDHMVS